MSASDVSRSLQRRVSTTHRSYSQLTFFDFLSVRGGQSLTKTIGIKVCGSFCHRISVTRSPKQISLVESGGCARQTPIQNWNKKMQLKKVKNTLRCGTPSTQYETLASRFFFCGLPTRTSYNPDLDVLRGARRHER